jgi:hypothetical protein
VGDCVIATRVPTHTHTCTLKKEKKKKRGSSKRRKRKKQKIGVHIAPQVKISHRERWTGRLRTVRIGKWSNCFSLATRREREREGGIVVGGQNRRKNCSAVEITPATNSWRHSTKWCVVKASDTDASYSGQPGGVGAACNEDDFSFLYFCGDLPFYYVFFSLFIYLSFSPFQKG